jgi:hypothetical protein
MRKNFYKPEWVAVWYGRNKKLYERPFDNFQDAQRESKRHKHAAVLYREIKVQNGDS